jgi:hypothetical protein
LSVVIGRLPRRLAAALTAVAATAALTGCATFTDADVAARVGDAELSEDQLASMLREVVGDEDADVAPMSAVSEILNNFVLDRALRADLAASGSPLPDSTFELTRTSLQESVGLAFSAWQSTPPNPIPPDVLRSRYESGLAESNIACTAHILVESEATAVEVLDRLEGGDEFADLAAEYSIDPGSASQGGVLPCNTTTGFQGQYIPEFVLAALDADVGEPVGPVESQFGYHVILVRPFDELAEGELDPVLAQPAVRFDFAVADLDVYVNPRYGSFDAARGVVPLG